MEQCKLCDEPADTLVAKIEASVIEMIKNNNPDWIEADGSCKKCISYYENLNDMIEMDD